MKKLETVRAHNLSLTGDYSYTPNLETLKPEKPPKKKKYPVKKVVCDCPKSSLEFASKSTKDEDIFRCYKHKCWKVFPK